MTVRSQVSITAEPLTNSNWSVVRTTKDDGKVLAESTVPTRLVSLEKASMRVSAMKYGYEVK